MANNPNHKENLKPFEKGEDERRNLEGRPKKLPPIEDLIAEVLGEDEQGRIQAKEILKALYKKATKGDTKAADILLDRAYGKAKQTMDVKHSGGINLNFKPADGNEPIPD